MWRINMKEYILTVKLQVNNPELNINLLNAKEAIETGKAKELLTWDGITVNEIKLEEYENAN